MVGVSCVPLRQKNFVVESYSISTRKFRPEIRNVRESFGLLHLRLDERAHHDGPSVDQRVVGQTFRIQSYRVEGYSTRLVSNVAVDLFWSKVFQCNGITNGFTRWLNWEESIGVSKMHSLSIDGTDWDSPIIRIRFGKFRNINCVGSWFYFFTFFENVFDFQFEIFKLGNNEFLTEDLLDDMRFASDALNKLEIVQFILMSLLKSLLYCLDSWIIFHNTDVIKLLHEFFFIDQTVFTFDIFEYFWVHLIWNALLVKWAFKSLYFKRNGLLGWGLLELRLNHFVEAIVLGRERAIHLIIN